MENSDALLGVLRSCRAVYDQEHQHLTPEKRDQGWEHYWMAINAQLNSSVPQKRSAIAANIIGTEPASKRAGHVC
jgi:hypothetical protein